MTGPVPSVEAAGVSIPKLGIGTWQLRGQVCASIVSQAIAAGYRLIDTAQGYENEAEVGEGIHRSGIDRDELFIVTKVRPDRLGRDAMERSVEESLRKLGTSQVDLLLIHWPNPAIPLEETIEALSEVRRAGLTRSIGLSNFTSALLERAVELTDFPFAAEQIEYHPYLDQRIMLGALRRHRMGIMAFCPIALGRVTSDPVIRGVAEAKHRTPVQVALRWLIQQDGVIAIPRTSKPERLVENFGVFDFELSDKDMDRLGGLARPGSRLVNEPKWVPTWD